MIEGRSGKIPTTSVRRRISRFNRSLGLPRNGLRSVVGAGGMFEAVIVALTLAFSLTALTWSWRQRGELLGGS
jgi:hypothetical protein